MSGLAQTREKWEHEQLESKDNWRVVGVRTTGVQGQPDSRGVVTTGEHGQ